MTRGAPSVERSRAVCPGTATIPGGQLLLVFTGVLGAPRTEGPITGGTGRYEGATGSYTSTGQRRDRDTFHVYLPKR